MRTVATASATATPPRTWPIDQRDLAGLNELALVVVVEQFHQLGLGLCPLVTETARPGVNVEGGPALLPFSLSGDRVGRIAQIDPQTPHDLDSGFSRTAPHVALFRSRGRSDRWWGYPNSQRRLGERSTHRVNAPNRRNHPATVESRAACVSFEASDHAWPRAEAGSGRGLRLIQIVQGDPFG